MDISKYIGLHSHHSFVKYCSMIVFNDVLIATFNVSNVYLGFTSSRFPF